MAALWLSQKIRLHDLWRADLPRHADYADEYAARGPSGHASSAADGRPAAATATTTAAS